MTLTTSVVGGFIVGAVWTAVLTFLFHLSIVFVPIASIIIVDFYVFRPAAYAGAVPATLRRVEKSALLAWTGGACVAVLGSAGYLRLTGIAAVDAMLVSTLTYGALRWRQARRPVMFNNSDAFIPPLVRRS